MLCGCVFVTLLCFAAIFFFSIAALKDYSTEKRWSEKAIVVEGRFKEITKAKIQYYKYRHAKLREKTKEVYVPVVEVKVDGVIYQHIAKEYGEVNDSNRPLLANKLFKVEVMGRGPSIEMRLLGYSEKDKYAYIVFMSIELLVIAFGCVYKSLSLVGEG